MSGQVSRGSAGDYQADEWAGVAPWRSAWLHTPVFLPGESPGQRNLVGYGPQGRKELDLTEVNVTHTHTHTPHFDVREYTVLKLLALGKLGGMLVFFPYQLCP